MPRHGSTWLGTVVCLICASLPLHANPPESPTPPDAASSFEATLALQKAMAMARAYLRMEDPKKAVDVLEQHLARVNGNTTYLELLRDAYRAYIKDLILRNQATAAQRYLQRLSILDPSAVNDPTLRPAESPKFVAAVKEEKPLLPNFAQTHGLATKIHKNETVPGGKAPIVRAIRELPGDDPFDLSNQRVALDRTVLAPVDKGQLADLLTKANEEFERRRYGEALRFYEKAAQIDHESVASVKDRLAYCMLDRVVDQLNRNAGTPMADLQKQVQGAMTMAPQLRPTAAWLLKEIETRGRNTTTGSTPDSIPEPNVHLQHYGKNPQGWMVTETSNFRIFHNHQRDLIERMALIAERTRLAMSRKWFGVDGADWSPKCELVLHNSANDYARQTGVPASSPGHSRIETDPTTYRVVGRRIDLHTDSMGFLEAVLPHETTHVVLAGNFGQHQVPRWADEGIAVLTEPLEKIEQHRRNLLKSQREGLLFPVRELMQLQNYPQPRQISAFYAQSVMLVEFLSLQRGPQVVSQFIRDGLNQGYESALRKHYGWSFQELQTAWNQQVLGEMQKLAAGR